VGEVMIIIKRQKRQKRRKRQKGGRAERNL